MKKLFFIMLFVGLALNQSKAQCQCCGSVSGFSGGESTPGAVALGKGKWMAEAYADHRSFSGISHQHGAHDLGISTTTALAVKNMDIGLLGIRYGVSDRIILLVQQPLFYINAASENSKTSGDLLSLVNYLLVNKPLMVIDIQGGMEWPTGQVVQFANGSSVSTGSGSFDPVAGLSFRRPLKRSFIRTSAFFKYTTKGYNQTYYGNFFGHQLNYTFFVSKANNICSPDSLKEKDKPLVSFNVQASGEWSQMQMKNNGYLENTGSYIALGTIGMALTYKGFSIPFTFSIPFYQNFHGEQNLTKYRVRMGITKTFN